MERSPLSTPRPGLGGPKYTHWKVNRPGGKGFWYYERRGFQRVRLPGLPWSPEFMAAYEKAEKAKPEEIAAARTLPNSLEPS